MAIQPNKIRPTTENPAAEKQNEPLIDKVEGRFKVVPTPDAAEDFRAPPITEVPRERTDDTAREREPMESSESEDLDESFDSDELQREVKRHRRTGL